MYPIFSVKVAFLDLVKKDFNYNFTMLQDTRELRGMLTKFRKTQFYELNAKIFVLIKSHSFNFALNYQISHLNQEST